MAAAAGPVHYLFLRSGEAVAADTSKDWPPPKELLGADDVVCAAVQLSAAEQGWEATALDHIPSIEEIPEGALVLTRDSDLGFTTGRPGSAVSVVGARVELDALRASAHLTHVLVVSADAGAVGRQGARPAAVPADRIVITYYEEREGRTMAALDLRMTASDLGDYPVWTPDAAIMPLAQDAVDRAVLSPRARHAITLEVQSGRVSLHGRVEIASTAEAAVAELERTPGVVDVVDHLLLDESLQDIVEQALASKGITGITALAEHGLISLHGEATTGEMRYKAQDIAAGVTGVRGVVNQIQVRQQV